MLKKGSLFFTLFLILMITGALLYTIVRSSSYLISLVREREVSEKHYYMAYALESFVKHHYKEQCDKHAGDKTMIFKGMWPDEQSGYRGYVWTETKKGLKKLYVQIKSDHKEVALLVSQL